MAASQHPTRPLGDELDRLPVSPVIGQALTAAINERIGEHVEQGTEDQARRLYGDEVVDDWFRSIGWDPDVFRAVDPFALAADPGIAPVIFGWDADMGAWRQEARKVRDEERSEEMFEDERWAA